MTIIKTLVLYASNELCSRPAWVTMYVSSHLGLYSKTFILPLPTPPKTERDEKQSRIVKSALKTKMRWYRSTVVYFKVT